jgi:hypothetical protein
MLRKPRLSAILVNLSRKIQTMKLITSKGYKKVEAELKSSGCEVLVRTSARTPAVLTEILGGISQSLQANDKTVS